MINHRHYKENARQSRKPGFRLWVKGLFPVVVVILLCIVSAGCTGKDQTQIPFPEYEVSSQGLLSVKVPPPHYTETPVEKRGNVSISRLTLQNGGTPVYALLAAPDDPVSAVVFAPGAGVKKEAHLERAVYYAEKGIAFLVLDIRGNGGETAGYALDLRKDYEAYNKGGCPQFYQIIGDLTEAGLVLKERYQVPVFVMGSSNGGMYAVDAAAADTGFAGCVGVSTTGFDRAGDTYEGDAGRFMLSIDPDVNIGRISPRPVLIFHSMADPVISFDDGMRLFNNAEEPKDFIAFNGTHGINREVDNTVSGEVLTFNAL